MASHTNRTGHRADRVTQALQESVDSRRARQGFRTGATTPEPRGKGGATAAGPGAARMPRLARLRACLPEWLCDRDTWTVINATAWMLVALYLLLYGPV